MGLNTNSVSGYFILANVYSNIGPNYLLERMRANTHASLRELNAFDHGPVKFEYRTKQQNLFQNYPPYDMCFMMDYDFQSRSLDCYYDTLVDFVFCNMISPAVYARHDVYKQIIESERKRYSSFGLAKLIYPVDDLFAYFSMQQLVDQLIIWRKIEESIQELFEEHKEKVCNGIPYAPPDKGLAFMNYVECYKHGTGYIAAQFHQIFNSTQILDEDMIPIRPKSIEYLDCVMRYTKETIDSIEELNDLFDQCQMQSPIDKKSSVDDAIVFVDGREEKLVSYRKRVLAYIDRIKIKVIRDCFLADHDTEDYVSKTTNTLHHLNTFILKKGEEMSPVAVRYFLYDVKEKIKTQLMRLIPDNKQLFYKINIYWKLYDNPETDYVENAQERIEQAKKETTIFRRLIGKNPYEDAMRVYYIRSMEQADNIRKYAYNKLLEEVLSGLLEYINILIGKVELFFEKTPGLLKQIDKEREWLLKMHDHSAGNIHFVSASQQIKTAIYQNDYKLNSPLDFPTEISGKIYRILYGQTYKEAVENKNRKTSKFDKDISTEEVLKIFTKDYIHIIENTLKEDDLDISKKNVINALIEDAMYIYGDKSDDVENYMLRIIHKTSEIAKPKSFYFLDHEIHNYYVWFMNPECLSPDTITHHFAYTLFGDDLLYRGQNEIEKSKFISPFEIVRISVYDLLAINQFNGYETYYKTYMEKMPNVSLHLDWHWKETLPNF